MAVSAKHQPVLLDEATKGLQVKPEHWYIDATFGRGGHTGRILELGGKVIALDHDAQAEQFALTAFAEHIKQGELVFIRANFTELHKVVGKGETQHQIYGVIFDFGTTVDQLTDSQRGFSFSTDGPLDMRMDDRLGVKAQDLLLLLDVRQLANMMREFGGEENARVIAKSIVAERKTNPITRTEQLVTIIEKVKRGNRGSLHPATKVFQALRIAVNTELENITASLPRALEILQPGGRIVTISFHEGEDRIVKKQFLQWETGQLGRILTKKPITPTEQEVTINPRSRSAKMRIFEKIQ